MPNTALRPPSVGRNWDDTMLSTWENLLIGALALLILFWMQPGIKAALARSRQAPSDWGGLIVPLVMVVMFVLFLIAMV
ncbi:MULTISPECIES: hypothetical protein [Methylomonas]|nr:MULTISPECIES: hypothetical protein [Methylomonas]WGS86297.1 hypothetical protein QC632_00715 [Methylomonas sp. UP202]